MMTGIEGALVQPVVDALMSLYKKAKSMKLKSTAEAALSEAIRELLQAPSDLKSPETKIAVAKAAGIISEDLVLAEEIVNKHKDAAKKAAPAKRVAAKKAPAKKAVTAKKVPAKKVSAKKTVTKRT